MYGNTPAANLQNKRLLLSPPIVIDDDTFFFLRVNCSKKPSLIPTQELELRSKND